ncbi:MAG: STAS domain-containing protein [Anaerolineales bacterium]|nr:STAS domain-containing protein [Anaerolineales bacterium]
MKLDYTELESGIRLIKLSGRLDMNGTYSVEVQFVNHCSGGNVRMIVDLSDVSFLSSVGIPMLVNNAQAVTSRGGKFVLLRPQESVASVLELVGVTQVIPIYNDLHMAVASLK